MSVTLNLKIRLHINWPLVYTVAYCGELWGKVGQIPTIYHKMCGRMEQLEQLF
jgi:hypothetical protein